MILKGKKIQYVHRLIALAWHENTRKLPQVNHKDGNKQNNFYENLEWVSAKTNVKHAVKTGLNIAKKGFDNANAKLNRKQVLEIKNLLASGKLSQYKIGVLFNVSRSCILNIKRKVVWADVNE